MTRGTGWFCRPNALALEALCSQPRPACARGESRGSRRSGDIHHFSFVDKKLLKTLILLSITRNVQAASSGRNQAANRAVKRNIERYPDDFMF
jgi:hypothetical protein